MRVVDQRGLFRQNEYSDQRVLKHYNNSNEASRNNSASKRRTRIKMDPFQLPSPYKGQSKHGSKIEFSSHSKLEQTPPAMAFQLRPMKQQQAKSGFPTKLAKKNSQQFKNTLTNFQVQSPNKAEEMVHNFYRDQMNMSCESDTWIKSRNNNKKIEAGRM